MKPATVITNSFSTLRNQLSIPFPRTNIKWFGPSSAVSINLFWRRKDTAIAATTRSRYRNEIVSFRLFGLSVVSRRATLHYLTPDCFSSRETLEPNHGPSSILLLVFFFFISASLNAPRQYLYPIALSLRIQPPSHIPVILFYLCTTDKLDCRTLRTL